MEHFLKFWPEGRDADFISLWRTLKHKILCWLIAKFAALFSIYELAEGGLVDLMVVWSGSEGCGLSTIA